MHPDFQPARALALDFGRVLTLEPDRAVFDTLLAKLGIDAAVFHKAYGELRHDYDRGALDAVAYWTHVLRICLPDLGLEDAEDLVPQLIDADFFSWAQPRTTLHQLVQQALDKGMLAAIVSNMPLGVGDRFVHYWPWLDRIRHRFFSADFGLVKPDDGFYLHVLEKTGWAADQILFVDDLPANVATAQRLGFQTLLFTGSPRDLDKIAAWCGLGAYSNATT